MRYITLALILAILVGLCWTNSTPAAQNPFVSGKSQKSVNEKSSPISYPQFLHPIFSKITRWQRNLRKDLTRYGKAIHEQPYGKAFWSFLLFSFAYGVIHAIGPGHGKTIVVSYFLSRPGKYLHGVIMGHLLTFVHVFSAVCAILAAHFILETSGLTPFEAIGGNLERISYSLLIAIGLILLGKHVYELKHRHPLDEKHIHPDEHSFKHLLLTAFVTGLVPCPGAALILIFTINQQILPTGLLAMFCVAFGMGLTTSAFALLAIGSRSSLLHLTMQRQKMFAFSQAFLSIGGALLITCIGSLLLLGQG